MQRHRSFLKTVFTDMDVMKKEVQTVQVLDKVTAFNHLREGRKNGRNDISRGLMFGTLECPLCIKAKAIAPS